MFSTEIIINSLLYALNQSVNSDIDVLGTEDSTKDLYLQIKELCNNWGVTDTMLRNCWQFESGVWDDCVRKFNGTHFEFASSIGTIQVTIYPNDMVFFYSSDTTLKDIENDMTLELFGTKYFNYDLVDGARYYGCFTGFDTQDGARLTNTERYKLLYKVAQLDGLKASAAEFIKELIRSDLLYDLYGCAEDAVGNRPCDNGILCDLCRDNTALYEMYNKALEELGIDK